MQLGYVLRRLLQFVIVLWAAATINFILPRLAPGNPVRDRLLSQASQGGPLQEGIEEMVRSYNTKFGLDKPLYVQYGLYLEHAARLDFGYSIANYPNRVIGTDPQRAAVDDRAARRLVGHRVRARHASSARSSPGPRAEDLPVSRRSGDGALRRAVLPTRVGADLRARCLAAPLPALRRLLDRHDPAFQRSPSCSTSCATPSCPASPSCCRSVGFWVLGMRGMMITTKGEDYINFAEAKGLKDRRIFFSYACAMRCCRK